MYIFTIKNVVIPFNTGLDLDGVSSVSIPATTTE